MFSVIFPGQGSQFVGMAKEFYDNFEYVREFFSKADDLMNKKISKIILEGPKDDLDLTENTQPAIFLVSYSIFNVLKKEGGINLLEAKYYAGHSLGEYSALCCSNAIDFNQTINLLRYRGKAMQNATPKGMGGMIAILGVKIDDIHKILSENQNKFKCYVANDNSVGQIVVSGKIDSLESLGIELKKSSIKFVKLPVSAPFHCPLMQKATEEMKDRINNSNFTNPLVKIVSNVNAKPQNNSVEIKKLLIDQIEKPVRWRESVRNMIDNGTHKFIEIGPGKVLSGLIKRIDRNIKLIQVNNLSDIKNINND
jgi:[acyl-carrier-protein] S-malonyltransferase